MSARPVRVLQLVGLACLLLALPAATAGAATISYDSGGTLVYSADPGETLDTTVGFSTACGTDCATFHGDATLHYPTAQCDTYGASFMCLLTSAGVRVVGGDGNDDVSVLEAGIGGFPAATPYPIAIDGGAGDDVIDGGTAGETIHGGPGADKLGGRGGADVLYGDDGNDTLLGDGFRNGNESSDGAGDQLYGGAGDDTLTGDAIGATARVGADLLDGGPGTDTVDHDWYRYDGSGGDADPAPTVTFDGQANDGRPGENDDVVGIERISSGVPAGATQTTYVGDDGPNTFELLFTNGVVKAGGGDDVVTGSDYADAIDGGSGNDKLSGGFGDDTITGGPGQDDIGGDRTAACFYGPIYGICTIGSGNDTIYAQDGQRDTIDCGQGIDTAYVDAVDVVAGCETVHVSGGGGSGGGGGGTTPTAHHPPAATLVVGRQHLATIARARAIRLTCRLPRAGRCTVRVTIPRALARKLHLTRSRSRRAFPLGSGHVTLRRAGRGVVRIHLSRATAHALRHLRALHVTLTITATYPTAHRTTTKVIKLRR